MNNTDINLLRAKDEGVLKEEGKVRRIWFLAIVFFLATLISLIVSVVMSKSAATSVASQGTDLLQKASSLHLREEKMLILTDRLRGVSDILKLRVPYGKTIGAILGKLPQGVSIEKFDIDKNTFLMIVSSSNLAALNTLVEGFTAMAKNKEIIKTLTLVSLTGDPKGGRYLATLQAGL